MTTPLAPVLWELDAERREQTHLARFAARVGLAHEPYATLHRWSVADPGAFWSHVWEYAELEGDPGATTFVRDEEHPMTGSRFFPDGVTNLAANLLRGPAHETVVVEAGERGVAGSLTRAELRTGVARAQAVLDGLGVEPGDRVAGLLPNTADALCYTLATLASGAVWTSCAPEFGPAGVLDRLGQVEPVVLVAAESYVYDGRRHDLAEKTARVAAELGSLRHVVLVGEPITPDPGAGFAGVRAAVHRAADLPVVSPSEPRYADLPFDHPAFILYTSGTTGLPKSILHRTGGVLLNLVKEHLLHGDVRSGDRMLYFTNTAWMMYHWSISALACGASVVLYDGAAVPAAEPALLWRLADELEVTHFGTSPKYLSVMAAHGVTPGTTWELHHLRAIFSAGAPLLDSHFSWVYAEVKADLMLASISGGTEILGCFVLGNPLLPVRSAELQAPGLGLAVAALDARGLPVVGRTGDLVCTEPFPSMPLTFWGPGGHERYLDSYFSERPEVWTHGDLVEMRPSGGAVITGRTDTTLKPGGVRIGTSEIYRVVEDDPSVADSMAIGYPQDDDQEIWLFVVPAAGREVDATALRRSLRAQASPRHVPRRVFRVDALPYNLAGKKVEGAVLSTVLGREVRNIASLVNPESLAALAPELLDRSEVR
ncbi:acetoacetate--CoA ligase [Phycicoccus sp. DTK01]|uniref:acetoacetate--CoA ligase n=1 Tax=Phycicoccus sp. DTK01 TaxID=2785745 RepID=UPI001A8E0A8C|nr:acetoacetate--CoA ligase [Phycicoccus sp. DTK01]GIL36718.1 acetoacetate-CoA ligase [Phycicoccus sp. DTK01]